MTDERRTPSAKDLEDDHADRKVDAVVAVVLVLLAMAIAIYWVANQ